MILGDTALSEPALAAVDQAIAIDPQSAAFHGFRAHLLSRRSKWRDALTAAETGLSLDPEDSQCAAIRVFALERLGRVSDAVAEAESAIRQNPDSADAHASRGWALLQKGQIRQSQESFREALRLEPSSEFARAGMMQALNSSNFVFRFFYRILNWLSRLDSRFQFGLLIGLWLGMNALQTLAKSNPWLSRWILPISVCYLLFVMMSWIIHPLFNTLLRFHPFGRHLLSKKEVWASNLIAGTLSFGVVIGVASSLRNGGPIHALLPILHSIYLTIPISVAFAARVKGAQITAIVVAIGFGLLYLLNSGLAIAGLFANTLIMAFTYGIVVYCFVGQRLMSGEPQH